MADLKATRSAHGAIPITFRDMGDGTFAEVVAFTAASPVELTGDVVVDTFGALDDASETDPDAASATIPSLLRGFLELLAALFGAKVTAVAALGAGGSGAIGWLSAIMDRLASSGVVNAAGETHIGSVGGHTKIVQVVLSLDTGALNAGEVGADTQVVTDALRVNDGTGVLQSIVLLDKDDQTAAGIDLVFLSANVVVGVENELPSITDANAEAILGIVSLAAGDFIDLGGAKLATLRNIGLPVVAATGTKNIYVAAIVRGAPTQTASGIVLRLGFQQN